MTTYEDVFFFLEEVQSITNEINMKLKKMCRDVEDLKAIAGISNDGPTRNFQVFDGGKD